MPAGITQAPFRQAALNHVFSYSLEDLGQESLGKAAASLGETSLVLCPNKAAPNLVH
ncbi:MAG: hypothetical protein LUQ59_05025 [Methanothrix sp.]|nr:hypothetical protein [Methanothrix sp.]